MVVDRVLTASQLSGALRFRNADTVLDTVHDIVLGWNFHELTGPDIPDRAAVSVVGNDDGWQLTGPTMNGPVDFTDPVSAACGVIAHAFKERMREDHHFLCLHAAAVQIGDGLLVMPCRYRAGKSVLTAALAAVGQRVFNDDVIMIDPQSAEAVAPGIAVRLRLPLPDSLDQTTRDFVTRRAGVQGSRYLYLDLPETIMARCGDRAPIRGFVLLNRQEDGRARLDRVAPGHLLRKAVWQNFARAGGAGLILDTLTSQIQRAVCLQLTYANVADARDTLLAHFRDGVGELPDAEPVDHLPDQIVPAAIDAAFDVAADARIRRSSTADMVERSAEAFLTTTDGTRILHLNATARALWVLLATPRRYREILDTFKAAFPEAAPADLDRDLQGSLSAFKAHGLIELERRRARSRSRAIATLLAGLVTFAGVTLTSGVASAFVIEGCEAGDMHMLLQRSDRSTWAGAGKVFGPLRLTHTAAVTCDAGSCRVDEGLRRERLGAEGTWLPMPKLVGEDWGDLPSDEIASMPPGLAPAVQTQAIAGGSAVAVRKLLDAKGFDGPDGDRHYVWVDYGDIAGGIRVRARSEITCSLGETNCKVSTRSIVYIDYNEHTPCPRFGG